MSMADSGVRTVGTEEVSVTSLDDVLPDLLEFTTLGIKIDVQGSEGEVLAGASATLERAAWVEMDLALTPVYEGQIMLRERLA
jgi:FkbM family methyltransferase